MPKTKSKLVNFLLKNFGIEGTSRFLKEFENKRIEVPRYDNFLRYLRNVNIHREYRSEKVPLKLIKKKWGLRETQILKIVYSIDEGYRKSCE